MSRIKSRKPSDYALQTHRSLRGLAIALLLLLGAMTSAHAQSRGGHGGRRQQQQATPDQTSQEPPAPALPAAAPLPWPRLEIGATLCSSRDDLIRYQAETAGGAQAATSGREPDCHRVLQQAGIEILRHDGPSRTQIVTTDESKETGWTNTYFPSTPPH